MDTGTFSDPPLWDTSCARQRIAFPPISFRGTTAGHPDAVRRAPKKEARETHCIFNRPRNFDRRRVCSGLEKQTAARRGSD